MKKYQVLLLALVAVLLVSCGSKDEKKNETNEEAKDSVLVESPINLLEQDTAVQNFTNSYHSDKINWGIRIPDGWTKLDNSQLVANDEQANSLLAPPEDENTTVPKLEYLVAFQKDDYHLFSATIEPYTEQFLGEYLSTFKDIKNNIYTAYRSQKINVDTSSGIEVIGGKEFLFFNTKIYDQTHMYIMDQMMYSAMYKGYDLSFNISYKDKKELDMLLGLLNESKFE